MISENLQFNIPAIIKSYIPVDRYEQEYHELFEMVLQELLVSGKFATNASTMHLLVETAINYARNEEHIQMIKSWLEQGYATDKSGHRINGTEISMKHKHLIVRRVFTSTTVDEQEKHVMLQDIEGQDQSDWMEKTRYFCQAALPTMECKEKMWHMYFDEDIDWAYSNYHMSFQGFQQVTHRHLLEAFKEDFFKRIPEIFKKKGRFVAEAYYSWLQPTIYSDDETISRFEKLLEKVIVETPNATNFIKDIKTSLHDLRVAQKGRVLNEQYLAQHAL